MKREASLKQDNKNVLTFRDELLNMTLSNIAGPVVDLFGGGCRVSEIYFLHVRVVVFL